MHISTAYGIGWRLSRGNQKFQSVKYKKIFKIGVESFWKWCYTIGVNPVESMTFAGRFGHHAIKRISWKRRADICVTKLKTLLK